MTDSMLGVLDVLQFDEYRSYMTLEWLGWSKYADELQWVWYNCVYEMNEAGVLAEKEAEEFFLFTGGLYEVGLYCLWCADKAARKDAVWEAYQEWADLLWELYQAQTLTDDEWRILRQRGIVSRDRYCNAIDAEEYPYA